MMDIAITTDSLKSDWFSLRDDFNSLKDIVTKRLQEDNAQLQAKYDCLEKNIGVLQSSINDLEINDLKQYGWRNNLTLLGIPDSISDDDLKETLTAILSDTDIQVIENDAQGCHRTRNSDKNNKSKKTIIRFVNRKHWEKSSKLKKIGFPWLLQI